MSVKRLKPKNDFIFQRLFGEKETKDSLMSLLNAILRLEGPQRIVDLDVIENKQLAKQLIDDKTGRLDILAETGNRVQINVEVQLNDYHNMARRTLFYLSKLYTESIKAGGKYEDLKKTITINLVDFKLFDYDRFHSTFHFYEDHEDRYLLTDAMEVHFLEYPKFQKTAKNLNDPLHRWLLFLDEKLSEEQIEELTMMDPEIRKTEERLEWLSGDEETRRLYEAREHSLIERNSLIAESEARGEMRGRVEGRAEGRAEGIKEVARNLLLNGVDPVQVAKLTGLSIEEISRL